MHSAAIDWSEVFKTLTQYSFFWRGAISAFVGLVLAIYLSLYGKSFTQKQRLLLFFTSLVICAINWNLAFMLMSVYASSICGWWWYKGKSLHATT